MLKCPRTGERMVQIEIDGVVVDVSSGCGGVWFDNQEIKKFDEQHEAAGQELLRVMAQFHKPVADMEKRLRCPKGCDAVMMRKFFSPKRSVSIDECPACGGVWLDPGELGAMQKDYKTEAERKAAGEAFVAELAERAGIDKSGTGESPRRQDSALRWIFPSWFPRI